MPKTRPDRTRDDKRDEILAAAERRLRDGGYDALSVAAIARDLGLAQNAIYWYFPSKDHLFVAALERIKLDIAARKPKGTSIDERVLWFTDEFEPLAALRPAMTERARRSEVVAAFVAGLDALLARMMANALRGRVPDGDLDQSVAMMRATIEGTYVKGLPRKERRELLRFALDRLARGTLAP